VNLGPGRPLFEILHVVGARPNFMKMAAVHRVLAGRFEQGVVHTGQHYDWRMSGIFFDELGIPVPDFNLEVGSGSHARQTAEIMIRLEPVIVDQSPRLVIVYGDVNSTMATALVCAKLLVRVAHVEAGLRSRDRTMPEEINRIVTDSLADVLFTPSADADVNLAAEGVPAERIHLVGNVMIDTLVRLLPRTTPDRIRQQLGIDRAFALVTLHRPSNVDNLDVLLPLLGMLGDVADRLDVVFPVHPRTRERIADAGARIPPRLRLLDPLGYLDFLSLERIADVVITDSGGVQEETTFLGIPCVTVRANTERPVTISHGTNVLAGSDPAAVRSAVMRILDDGKPQVPTVPLWDGCAGERIARIIENGVA
jgi:UDP-N-acetylglucosamine 2-epimerase (non-hydrolysing)